MMRAIGFLAVTIIFLQAGDVQADLITLNGLAPQTVAGENFTFSFSPIAISDGTSGTLTIHARGDYDPGTSTEFLTWDIDSLGIGSTAGPTIGGVTIIQNNGINDVQWEQSFIISGVNMLSITSDLLASILIDLNGNQTAGVGVGVGPNEFVEVTLSYNSPTAVPEPASLTLFGMGALGLVAGAIRRRRSQKATV